MWQIKHSMSIINPVYQPQKHKIFELNNLKISNCTNLFVKLTILVDKLLLD